MDDEYIRSVLDFIASQKNASGLKTSFHIREHSSEALFLGNPNLALSSWINLPRGVARIFSLGGPNYIFIHTFTQLHFYPLTLNYPLLFFSFNMFSLDQALKNNWKLNNNNNNKRLSHKLKIKYKNYMCVCVRVHEKISF